MTGKTGVSDLAPIAEMTGLRILSLTQTGVSDLRPLTHMDKLGDRNYGGLWFEETPASRLDEGLAKLVTIERDELRSKEVLAYLKTLPPWPEPLPWLSGPKKDPKPPEQDPALPLSWGEKGFTFLANSIDTDPVTEAALADLRDLLEDLRRKGNRHDDLYRVAGEVQDRCKGEVRDLNMVRLHLSYQKLRRLYQSRVSRTEAFDDETVGVLGSVLEILPGVTMADPQVEILIKRQEADQRAGAVADTVKAEQAVLTAMQSDDAPFAPEVKEAAKDIAEPGQDDRLSATRRILSRNGLIAVLRFLRHDPVGAGVTSSLLATFALSQGPALLTLALTMGTDAFLWAQMTLATVQSEYQIAAGVAKEVLGSGKVTAPKRPRSKHQ